MTEQHENSMTLIWFLSHLTVVSISNAHECFCKREGYLCILYVCESWTWTVESETRKKASEVRGYQRMLNLLYMNHITIRMVAESFKQPFETMTNS